MEDTNKTLLSDIVGLIIKMHGVKGQKWGVTRKKPSSSSSSSKKKKTTISDDELKKRVKRLKLEKEYKSLTSEKKKSERGAGSKATAHISKIVVKSGTSVAEKQLTAILNSEFEKYAASRVP